MNSYQDLLDAIINWPDRPGDVDLTAVAPTLIQLSEAMVGREVRLRRMIKALPLLAGAGATIESYLLPDDYLEMYRVDGPDGESLEMRTVDELRRCGDEPDGPTYWGVDGSFIRFVLPVSAATLYYYQRMSSLSLVSSHWLFAKAPDLYLGGALYQAAIFDKATEGDLSRYRAMYDEAKNSLLFEEAVTADSPRGQPLRSIPGRPGRKRVI